MINFEHPGRMISGSKIAPKGHVCVFNANVCSKSRGKFWYGDLDLTADERDLRSLAEKLGEEIYVLREMDARFDTEDAPRFEKAVARISPDGIFVLVSGAV